MNKIRLLSIGTSGITDEEAVNRIIIVNKFCLAFSIALLIIAPVVGYFVNWKLSVLIPISVEFVINGSVIILNHYKRHRTASIVLYFLQCAAIPYFGILLGRLLQLQFTIVFMIAIVYLIFKETTLRKIALAAALLDLAILEVAYYFSGKDTQSALPISYNAAFLIHALVIVSVISLIILVSKPYVKSNDTNAELKRANHFIKIFVAQVTHELRTPLDSIHQVTQLLRKEVRKNDHLKQIQPLLDISFTASCDARNIVNNVLDMAEIESGKTPGTVNEAFQVAPFLEKILEVHQVIAQEEQMKLQLYMEMPPVIISDPLNINQILTNLLANAIKYGLKGSTVNVEARRRDNSWELKVSNVGPGIPSEKIASIFDPFVTGKTGQTQGSGLGLYIVRSKVISMNGTVQVQSKPGGYTIFTVTLPLIEGRLRNLSKWNEEGENSADNRIDLSNIHVLMAEDSKLTALLLIRSLKEMGCKVTIVNNGLELLLAAQKGYPDNCPDIIILDCHMPVLNGEETILQLKKIPALSNIPIIVTTGDLFSDMLDRMLAAGADAYLKKPIDHLALQKTISLYLKKQH